MGKQRKPPGRPTKTADPGKQVSLGLKVTSALKSRLDDAARKSGRTQSKEAELRLENTFRDEDRLDNVAEFAYGRQLAGALALLGRVMKDAGSFAAFQESPTIESAVNWMESPEGIREATRAALTVLAEVSGDKSLAPASDEGIGVRLARGALEAVANPQRSGEIGTWAAPIRAMLGKVARRISIDTTAPIAVLAFRPETGIAGIATMGKNKEPKS